MFLLLLHCCHSTVSFSLIELVSARTSKPQKCSPVYNSASDSLVFAGVKFPAPISHSLRSLNIQKASAIQSSAIVPLVTGLSCILHAETGSGKTLTYLLPILKGIISENGNGDNSIKALIVVPTKELAVQVSNDIVFLVGNTSYVHICLSGTRQGLSRVKAPIVVGTSYKLLDALQNTNVNMLEQMKFLVLDEVDRLLPSLGKYGDYKERKVKHEKLKSNPTVELIYDLCQSFVKESSEYKNNDDELRLPFQVIGASATVGRPLRRNLYRVFKQGITGDKESKFSGQFTVVRPQNQNEGITAQDNIDSTSRRQIGIPKHIKHVIVVGNHDNDSTLSNRLIYFQRQWSSKNSKYNLRKSIVFVPTVEEVIEAINILKFWGIKECRDLQQKLGLSNDRPTTLSTNNTDNRMSRTEELLSLAKECKIGNSADGSGNSAEDSTEIRNIDVISVAGSRGLHVNYVDSVVIVKPPKAMDEYLHMAGRTGRLGGERTDPEGIVITVATLEELKRMQSWQSPLGITFDVEFV